MAGALKLARLGALLEAESDQLDNSCTAMKELHAATRKLERILEKNFLRRVRLLEHAASR